MSEVDTRFRPWLDIVGDLLRQPRTQFARHLVLRELGTAFQGEPSWNWIDPDGTFGFELLHPRPNWPQHGEWEYWRTEGMPRHPVINWFDESQSCNAQSIGRVPLAVSSQGDRDMVRRQLRPVGLDEQLWMPYRFSGGAWRMFLFDELARISPTQMSRSPDGCNPSSCC